MLSIVGSSGAGKTTVCKAVMGLLSSNYSISGEVLYSDKIANYDFPPDANFTAVQNITLK